MLTFSARAAATKNIEWYSENAAANAEVQMLIRGGGGTNSPNGWFAPRNCSIVAIRMVSNEVRSAGTAGVKCYVAGLLLDSGAILDGTNTQNHTVRYNRGQYKIATTTLQALFVDLVTVGWAPNTADIRVSILVEF